MHASLEPNNKKSKDNGNGEVELRRASRGAKLSDEVCFSLDSGHVK